MSNTPAGLLPSKILIVDDERQIHASVKLRLGSSCELTFATDGRSALDKIQEDRFDLCIADINMPEMNGLAFIEAAQEIDATLGFVILSAFDSPENLRQAIHLQIYDFVTKPLPERAEFEDRIPGWTERTRIRRQDRLLALKAGELLSDRDAALLERDVELVASETARNALRQTAGLLTTIHAHILTSATLLAPRAKGDPALTHLLRGLEEARKTADAAVNATESFFDSSYGNRDSSPAVLDEGIRHAANIALHMSHPDGSQRTVDYVPTGGRFTIQGLSGIEFLLAMAPAVGAALAVAKEGTTVGIRSEPVNRLDSVTKHPAFKGYFWVNRRHGISGSPGVAITITAEAPSLSGTAAERWLNGDFAPLGAVGSRGLVRGIQKCRGLLGIAVPPQFSRFALTLLLPI
jgi:CheY-like chemotaxis protein